MHGRPSEKPAQLGDHGVDTVESAVVSSAAYRGRRRLTTSFPECL